MREFMILHPELIANVGIVTVLALLVGMRVRLIRRQEAAKRSGTAAPSTRPSALSCLVALAVAFVVFSLIVLGGAMVFH
jgi:hypothetical protein